MGDTEIDEQRERFVAWLTRDGGHASPVMRETHVSFVAFAGDRVWKCKKAVRFPFVDLSTLELRRANCEREVALNRRLAPDVYLGVVPVKGGGTVVDYVVEMRRLPDDRRLATVIGRDAHAGDDCVDAVAELLARFHGAAVTGGVIDRAGTRAALAELWRS